MPLICSLSSEPCREPVTTKNGHIFERRLIEKYIQNSGTDPITNQPLTTEDLIVLKVDPSPDTLKPREPGAQGIPGIIQSLQSEWDALMLEMFNLRQEHMRVRKQLAHYLYQHDAACRVIARISSERDQYMQELSKFKAQVRITNVHNSPSSSKMDADKDKDAEGDAPEGLSEELQDLIAKKKNELCDIRMTYKISPSTITSKTLSSSMKLVESHLLHIQNAPGITCVDIHPNQVLFATGGVDTSVVLFDRSQAKKIAILSGHTKSVTAVKFHPTDARIISADDAGDILVWAEENASWTLVCTIHAHSSSVASLDIHPIGTLILASSADRTFSLCDIQHGKVLARHLHPKLQTPIAVAKFHPDGEIMATAGEDNHIHIWKVCTQEYLTSFEGHTAKITGLSFSENGRTLASSGADHTIKLWDLSSVCLYKTLELDAAAIGLSFDHSGRFLAALYTNEIRVFAGGQLELVKSFSEDVKDATGFTWGQDAKTLALTSLDGSLKIWSV
ncbi:pre-mRNA-processing factor 19-like [Schistocerca gregaria]|uniref:pre-mRNA-processing factor 19-like n=1 Tax=Schistocerca gregaria TaxID=7010 RepID=UPI00211DDC6E|nr:pre-mRNA-processing factor 19-like [Schistocerca gregaria]